MCLESGNTLSPNIDHAIAWEKQPRYAALFEVAKLLALFLRAAIAALQIDGRTSPICRAPPLRRCAKRPGRCRVSGQLPWLPYDLAGDTLPIAAMQWPLRLRPDRTC